MIDHEPGRGLFFKRRPRIFAASVVMVAAAVIRKIVMPKNVFCFLAPQLNSPLHSTPSNGKKVFDLIRLRDEVNVGNRDRWMKIIEKKREREKNGKVNKVISLLALALRRRFLLDYFLVVQCKRPTWEMKENEQSTKQQQRRGWFWYFGSADCVDDRHQYYKTFSKIAESYLYALYTQSEACYK